jgi:hypothetical protein
VRERRADFGRRARAAAAWGVALFFGGQLAIGLLLDYRYPLTRFPSGAQAIAAARAEPRQPAVAFFGSSRMGAALDVARTNDLLEADSGLNPPPRAVSLAVPAGDCLTAEYLLDHLLAAGAKPRWVVVEISPETLNSLNVWMTAHVIRQLNWEHVVSHWQAARRGRALWLYAESRLAPAFTHRKEIVKDVKGAVRGWLPQPARRRGPQPLDWDDIMRQPDRPDEAEVLRRSRVGVDTVLTRWLHPYEVAGVSPEALERFLAHCRAEGIGAILLGIPACTAHREAITPDIDAQYVGYLDRVCREYGCRFVDARDWVPDELYLDAMHVRFESGAKVFTDRLVREVLLKLPLE